MATVAARAQTGERYTHVRSTIGSRSVGKGRSVSTRRLRSRFTAAKLLRYSIVVMAFACVASYVGEYANLSNTNHNMSQLQVRYDAAKIQNERLKLQLLQKSSPTSIEMAAQKLGMQYATQYDYMNKSDKLASAGGSR